MTRYRNAILAVSMLVVTALATPAAQAAAVPPRNVYLSNWAGYVTTHSSDGYTPDAVYGGWKVPDVTCTSTNDQLRIWAGLDGYGNSIIEQVGIAVDCSTGNPVYTAYHQTYPDPPVPYDVAVTPGETIGAAVYHRKGKSDYTLLLRTHGSPHEVGASGPTSNVSAEIVMESPTSAFPDFGRMAFFQDGVNGTSLVLWDPTPLNASNQAGLETRTMPITKSGWGFHIRYLTE